MSIALAIALAIALLLELSIEFPMHLLIAFGCLVEAFWVGAFGEFFWTPGRLLGPFWAQDGKRAEQIELWPQFGRPPGTQFETILVILMTCWRLVFCCFFGSAIFSHFAVPGSIWGPICDAFWGALEPWK